MRHVTSRIVPLVLIALFATSAVAQDAAPKEPFKAMHLVTLKTPADIAALQAAITDMNKAVATAGYPGIRYRLYKVVGKQAGEYSYLWESTWPGGEVYDKVHNHPEWIATTKRHPKLDVLMKDQIYNRYVEVLAAKK